MGINHMSFYILIIKKGTVIKRKFITWLTGIYVFSLKDTDSLFHIE
jgi:hypothetical protein